MATLADLLINLSGGAANTDPAAALGGAMSTAAGGRVLSQTASGLTITGVTIDDAMGNTVGSGSLFYDFSETALRWTPPGGTAGAAVNVGTNGEYALQGGNDGGVLLVTVVAASLPGADATNTIAIANQVNKIFDDVSKAESQAGDAEYRGLFFENDHSADAMIDAKFWIAANTPGQDVISIAIADEDKNLAIETIANESTAPVGPDFDTANPVSYASGIALTTPLEFGDYEGFWLRRVVPAGVTAAQANNTFRLGFRIYV